MADCRSRFSFFPTHLVVCTVFSVMVVIKAISKRRSCIVILLPNQWFPNNQRCYAEHTHCDVSSQRTTHSSESRSGNMMRKTHFPTRSNGFAQLGGIRSVHWREGSGTVKSCGKVALLDVPVLDSILPILSPALVAFHSHLWFSSPIHQQRDM